MQEPSPLYLAFTEIIRANWTFDEVAEATLRERAEAAAFLAEAEWLRS